MERWTDNINGEPYTLRGVRTVRGRVFGDPAIVIWKGAGCLAYIVTTNIKADGKRIELHNLGKNQSEKARKEIEIAFGLVKAEDSKQQQIWELKPVNVQKVQYGRSETKRAITNVLDAVLKNYKYTSLPELNAVLQQYNVIADKGNENSRVYQNNGLTYRILDDKREKVGVPIKASDFYNKPTLKFLEERFALNEVSRQPNKARVKNAIDIALHKEKALPIQILISALEKKGIYTVLRQNPDGIIYGITYVDHQTRCVFNGSALGKQYSAKAILERCHQKPVFEQNLLPHSAQKPIGLQPQAAASLAETKANQNDQKTNTSLPEIGNALDALMQPEQESDYLPYQLKKRGRKKKRKNLNNNQ